MRLANTVSTLALSQGVDLTAFHAMLPEQRRQAVVASCLEGSSDFSKVTFIS